jgi:hypothetical protein
MTEALKKIESQLKKIEAGKTAAAKFAAFLDLSKLMAAAAEVIETFEGLPGGDNAVFGKYLHRQGELIRDLDKHPAVEPIIKGTALTDLPTKPAFAWTDSDWQKVKKAGVTGGLFPDSKTGIGAGIDDAQKAFAGFEKIKAKPKELKNARAAALDTMGKLAVLRRMVLTQLDRAKVIQKPNLIGYFEAARTETDARLTALTDWTKANPEPAAP